MNRKEQKLALLAGTVLLLGTGCLGSGDFTTTAPPGDPTPGDGSASGAAQSFAQASPVVAKCGGAGCHEGAAQPNFLGAPGRDDDYQSIKGPQGASVLGNFDGNAKIVTYGSGIHKGVQYAPAEKAAVEAWLSSEKGSPNAGQNPNPGGGPVPVATGGLAGWAACLTLADIQQPANGAQVAFATITNKGSNNGNCIACHEAGTDGGLMATDDAVMLAIMKGRPYGWVRLDETGKAVAAMEKWEYKGDGLQQTAGRPISLHPTYQNGPGDQYTVALQAMVTQVAQRQATGACQGGTPQGYY